MKDNPIRTTAQSVHILYGLLDDITKIDVVNEFCKRNNCALTTIPDAPHFLQKEEHLLARDAWITRAL